MGELDLQAAMEFANAVAREAGNLTLRYFQAGVDVELKRDDSPVTRADREAEQLIRDRIAAEYPSHGILGEEYGHEAGDGAYTWIIDPIDGTKSFVAGISLYSVLIACVRGRIDTEAPRVPSDDVLVGVIALPAMHETVSAARGVGCFWGRADGQPARDPDDPRRATVTGRIGPCRVSEVGSIPDARIMTTDFADLARRAPVLFEATKESGYTRTWGDAAGYVLVATGRAEVMIDPIMNPWDIGPLPVIIEEAGGTFTDLRGERVLSDSSIATNGLIHLPLR